MAWPAVSGALRRLLIGVVTVLVTAWLGVLAANAELTSAGHARPGTLPWPGGAYLLALGAAAALAWRVRWPLPSAAAVIGCVYTYRALGYPGEAPGIALFVSCYAIGVHGRQLRWKAAASAVTVLAVALPALPPHPASVVGEDAWAVLGPGLGLVAATALGASVRYARLEAEVRVRHVAQRAEDEIARRVTAHRLGIARELHDVLAHTISVISVQSALALDVLADDPQRARPALEIVRASSREAIEELRAAVRALRRDELTATPVPLTLAALERVADGARASGLTVTVHAPDGDGDGDEAVPPLLQATAFRIVQEALTNCLRHSRGRAVTIRVASSSQALTVEVVDDGERGTPVHGIGLGLRGIHERAEAVGGSAEVGWRPEGGFRVFARLPMPSPRPADPE